MTNWKKKYIKYKLKYINAKKAGATGAIQRIPEKYETEILVNLLGIDRNIVKFSNFLCNQSGKEDEYTKENIIEKGKMPPKGTRHTPVVWKGLAPQEANAGSVHWQAHYIDSKNKDDVNLNKTLDSTKGEYMIQLPKTHNFCQCYASYLCVTENRGIFKLLKNNTDKYTATENIQMMSKLLKEFLVYIRTECTHKTEFLQDYRDIMVPYEPKPFATNFLNAYDNDEQDILDRYIDNLTDILTKLEKNINNKAEILACNLGD